MTLGILSQALAAIPSAEYEISPANPSPRANAPVIAESATQRDIRGLVSYYARAYGVNEQLALELGDIESDYQPMAKNPSSTATGLFQWIKSSWAAHCVGSRTDPHDNTVCTMKTLQDPRGIRHWSVVTSTRERLFEMGLIGCLSFRDNLCEVIK